MSKFYFFRQNNTGGDFVVDSDLAQYMFIEANSSAHANIRAENIGMYFDGCEKEMDCPCCGDRWYEVDEFDGHDVPTAYGEPLNEYKMPYRFGTYEYRIHYLDGRVESGEID